MSTRSVDPSNASIHPLPTQGRQSSGYFATAFKVTSVALCAIASGLTFAIYGPIPGLIVTLISTLSLYLLFYTKCCTPEARQGTPLTSSTSSSSQRASDRVIVIHTSDTQTDGGRLPSRVMARRHPVVAPADVYSRGRVITPEESTHSHRPPETEEEQAKRQHHDALVRRLSERRLELDSRVPVGTGQATPAPSVFRAAPRPAHIPVGTGQATPAPTVFRAAPVATAHIPVGTGQPTPAPAVFRAAPAPSVAVPAVAREVPAPGPAHVPVGNGRQTQPYQESGSQPPGSGQPRALFPEQGGNPPLSGRGGHVQVGGRSTRR